MSKENVFQLRLEPGMREEIDEHATDQGITSSEWIRDAIEFYMNTDGQDIPSLEEIEDMDWNELDELIDELELDIDSNKFDSGGFLSGTPDKDSEDTDDLRNAVLDILGYLDDEDSESESEPE
jgi:predicted DNA-binding protein